MPWRVAGTAPGRIRAGKPYWWRVALGDGRDSARYVSTATGGSNIHTAKPTGVSGALAEFERFELTARHAANRRICLSTNRKNRVLRVPRNQTSNP
jgi:hypothetical protein